MHGQPAQQEKRVMNIIRRNSQPSRKTGILLTGSVRIDTVQGHRTRVSARVTFDPGARTAWHTHPLSRA